MSRLRPSLPADLVQEPPDAGRIWELPAPRNRPPKTGLSPHPTLPETSYNGDIITHWDAVTTTAML